MYITYCKLESSDTFSAIKTVKDLRLTDPNCVDCTKKQRAEDHKMYALMRLKSKRPANIQFLLAQFC